MIDTPYFLVGSVRSGTTMLRLLLDHHPRIAFNLESVFIVSQMEDDGAFPDMARYREWLAQDRSFQHSRFSVDPAIDYVELVNDFLHQKLLRDGKSVVGATVHFQFCRLLRIWPNARFIYLYRDARDVANSIVQMGWEGNPYAAADWWLRAEHEWESLCSRVPEDRRIEVKYERLVNAPREELERICHFMGVEYSERMYDYETTTAYTRPDAQLTEQWKKRMREMDIRLIEAKTGDRLVRRGYALSGRPCIAVSSAMQRYQYIHSRVKKFIWRASKYGPSLVAQEMLARRMRLSGIHERCMQRINAITDANLR